MKESSILDQQKFWNIIRYLIDLDSEKSVNDICLELAISTQQLNSFVHFLKEVDCQLEMSTSENEMHISPPLKTPTINLEFSLLEWLQFQAHFPAISTQESKPFHEDIKQKFLNIEKKYQKNDMYLPLQTLNQLYEENKKFKIVGSPSGKDLNQIVSVIEEAILTKSVVKLMVEDRPIHVYPRKILFFDGDFNIFGEGVSDSSLVNLSISHITSATLSDREWKEVFTQMELAEFISSLRSMSETGTRLVLKIYSYESFHLNLDYQYFENPCVFSNAEGEYIWAATIEKNDKIFEWLYNLGSDVEILDPKEFKREFLKYCENKLKKLA